MSNVPVRYIGKRDAWTDRLYGSGLTFSIGQVRAIPQPLSKRFLRHGDLFELADAAPVEEAAPQDDTAEQLAKAEAERAERDRHEMNMADLHRDVDNMDFSTLAEFAEQRYGLKLTKQKGLDKGRAEVHARIDQFGAA